MDAATIQNRLYKGYGKAALRLGMVHNQYRPAGAVDPLATVRGTLYASFNAEDFGYKRPNKYGAPTWYGVLDGSLTQPGDYLTGPERTVFIAAQQLHLPVLVVDCNRTICLIRPAAPVSVGDVGYSGEVADTDVTVLGQRAPDGSIAKGWPASILSKGRDEPTGTGLPATTKNAGWQILLPPSVPITIQATDILIDDLNRRYAVRSAELTDLGWRIQAVEEHA